MGCVGGAAIAADIVGAAAAVAAGAGIAGTAGAIAGGAIAGTEAETVIQDSAEARHGGCEYTYARSICDGLRDSYWP